MCGERLSYAIGHGANRRSAAVSAFCRLHTRLRHCCTGFAERAPGIVAGREHPYDDAVVSQHRGTEDERERDEQLSCLNGHAKGCCDLRQETEEQRTTVEQDVAYKQAEYGSAAAADMTDAEMQQTFARGAALKENAE